MWNAVTMSQLVSIAKDKNSSIPENGVELLGYEPTEALEEELEKEGASITQEVNNIDDVFELLDENPYDGTALDVITASKQDNLAAVGYLSDAAIDMIKVWAAYLYPGNYYKIRYAVDEGALGLVVATKNISPIHLANVDMAKSYMSKMIKRHMRLANIAV